jgi:hypothetical protein
MRARRSGLSTASLAISLSLLFGFITPGFAADLQRPSVPATEPVTDSLVPCSTPTQLDCLVKLQVEHADGSMEEAKRIETVFQDSPPFQNQRYVTSYSIYEFNSGKKNGPLQRVKVYSQLQTPAYTPDAKLWGVEQGKRWGVVWIYLDRVLLPGDPPFPKVACDGTNISTCLLDPPLNPDDVFHLDVKTSWLKPVSSVISAVNYKLNYKKIPGGTLWRFSGSEHLQSMFWDGNALRESVKAENQSVRPDFFTPALYFVVDHAGKDLSDSFWNPKCADYGFTATMINAPLAGQPYWDYQKESLIFNIYGPHLTPLGTLNKGFFQVNFHKAWLDCQYPGNTLSTAAELKISILDEAGTPQVAVTNVKMNKELIEISASGFHYSSPTIQIARKSAKNSTDVVRTTGYSDNWQELIQPKKSSITCMKGKVRKIVTAIKPACPSGYKKVSKP